MTQAHIEKQTQLEQKFLKLKTLITKRQEFEQEHPEPPYSQHPTSISFPDKENITLLEYAVTMGDLEKVQWYLENNAEIDTPNQCGETPIRIALANRQLKVAQYLYKQGADCKEVALSDCQDNTEEKEWLRKEISLSLSDAHPTPNIDMTVMKESPFFKKSWDFNLKEFYALKRAVEIGNIDLIRTGLQSKYNKSFSKIIKNNGKGSNPSLLIIAIKNGQLDMVKFLVANGAPVNSAKPYCDTPLMAAIEYNRSDIVDYLLEIKVDITQEDNYKNKALGYALIGGNENIIKKIMKLDSDFTTTNINGNTVLHWAIMNNSIFATKLLMSDPTGANLVHEKNIYGKTPLDLAIERKANDLIKILVPDVDLTSIQQGPHYGVRPTLVCQSIIRKKMLYRLKLKYRDTTYFSEKGYCNGFIFLKLFYAARGMQQYYFDTLALMANWDGEDSSLHSELTNIPQAINYHYKSLDEVFEQWTNDLIWFQHTTLSAVDNIKSNNRIEQYQMVKNDDGYQYQRLFLEDYSFQESANKYMESYKRTELQLTEILTYLMRMPIGTQFEFGGDQHATLGGITQQGLEYYDPNFRFPVEYCLDVKQMIRLILDYKYILLEKFSDKIECHISVNCFNKDRSSLNLDNFTVFKEEELPNSETQALSFQQNSANGFTPLHIAIITRSLVTLKKLLADGYCDINALDTLGRCAFKLAVDNNFTEAARVFLESTKLDLSHIDEIATKAYSNNQIDIVNNIINTFTVKSLNKLFASAIEKGDIVLVKQLFFVNKVNINQIHDGKLPLNRAISSNQRLILLFLLENKVDIFQESVMHDAMSSKFLWTKDIIEHLKQYHDINQNNCYGKSALYYAVMHKNAQAIKQLLDYEADVNCLTKEGETVLDAISLNRNYDNETIACLKLLIPTFKFDLTNSKDRTTLLNLLKNTTEDTELFKMVYDKCDPTLINIATFLSSIPKPASKEKFLPFHKLCQSFCDYFAERTNAQRYSAPDSCWNNLDLYDSGIEYLEDFIEEFTFSQSIVKNTLDSNSPIYQPFDELTEEFREYVTYIVQNTWNTCITPTLYWQVIKDDERQVLLDNYLKLKKSDLKLTKSKGLTFFDKNRLLNTELENMELDSTNHPINLLELNN